VRPRGGVGNTIDRSSIYRTPPSPTAQSSTQTCTQTIHLPLSYEVTPGLGFNRAMRLTNTPAVVVLAWSGLFTLPNCRGVVHRASYFVDETLGSLRWHAGVVRTYHTEVPRCVAWCVVYDTLGALRWLGPGFHAFQCRTVGCAMSWHDA